MIESKHLRNTVIAVLLVLFTAAGLWAETTDILSGRELLRIMRQKDGSGTRPAYAQREAEAKKAVLADANAEPAAELKDKEPEEPPALVTEPEQVAKPTTDELLRMVPAESLFCVRVNNFDYTLSTIDQFLAGVSPVPMGVSMLVRMQFANLLGSPQLNGVNMGGSFIAFGTMASDEPTGPNPANMFIGVLVPVTDYKQFIDGNPNCGQPDEKGISKITSGQALEIPATRINDNCALITLTPSPENYERLIATAKSISDAKSVGLAGALDAAEAQLAKDEPLWAYGNIQLVSRIFGPVVYAQLEQMKEIGPMEAQVTGLQPGDMKNIMNMYASILETLLKETKSVSLAINPKPNVLNITETISAVPDTNMANMLVCDASAEQENNLLRYLEDGAAMNFGFKMNTPFVEKLSDTVIELSTTMVAGTAKAEDIAKMKGLTANGIDALGGSVASSFSIGMQNKSPFELKYFADVKNADKFNKVIEEAVDLWDLCGITDFYKSIGMEARYTMTRNVGNYRGASIDSAKFVVKPTDPNSPQAQMISAMYGDGLDYRWAMVDGLWVCATCGDVDSTIREMIDMAKAGTPKEVANEMKAALALLPGADKADFMCTLNFLRLFNLLGKMMPMPMPMPQMDVPTKSNIALAGKVGGGRMTINIAVPKEHLTEIMSAIMMMQQQMMQQQMPTQALEHTQQLQKRMESAENLSSIGKACVLYANDHEDKYPANLQELVEKGYLSPEKLDSPRRPTDFDEPSYIYITGQTPEMPPDNIIGYENPKFCGDNINVLFNDTHVEPMKPAEFISELQATYERLGRELPPEIQAVQQ